MCCVVARSTENPETKIHHFESIGIPTIIEKLRLKCFSERIVLIRCIR